MPFEIADRIHEGLNSLRTCQCERRYLMPDVDILKGNCVVEAGANTTVIDADASRRRLQELAKMLAHGETLPVVLSVK